MRRATEIAWSLGVITGAVVACAIVLGLTFFALAYLPW